MRVLLLLTSALIGVSYTCNFSSDAEYLVRKKYLIGLMTAAPICANQRKTFSPMSVAMSDFSWVESADSIVIRLPIIYGAFF